MSIETSKYKISKPLNQLPPATLYAENITAVNTKIDIQRKFNGLCAFLQIHEHGGADETYSVNGKTLTIKANAKETFDGVEINSFELLSAGDLDLVIYYYPIGLLKKHGALEVS